jgi:hypothetical protein
MEFVMVNVDDEQGKAMVGKPANFFQDRRMEKLKEKARKEHEADKERINKHFDDGL